ncbi:hypothetical protein AXF42_Ash009724 [Apostasia shenzhenica]|uniref:Uncharacterized protein n=1 Tax=Apostasia shenzhenica TaxID=1088818 RepID=A0A2I0AWW8_9ASPA|nr:hypothetical protein AXF42_Ash009724 [Apostasia shenzhenica]
MAYGRRSNPSILDAFTLSPLPYPVLLILLTVFVFLAISWSFSYEDLIGSTEEQMSWGLLLLPLALILLIRWISSAGSVFDADGPLGFLFPYDRRHRRSFYSADTGGGSPWGVAAVVVLLIVLASFQSTFLSMWGP